MQSCQFWVANICSGVSFTISLAFNCFYLKFNAEYPLKFCCTHDSTPPLVYAIELLAKEGSKGELL